MRTVLFVLALVALLLATVAEPLAPTVEIDETPAVIGKGTSVTARARDRGRGLAALELRLLPASTTPVALETRLFPLTSLLGSGVHEATITVTPGADMPEGPAILEAWARDHSWLSLVRGDVTATRRVTIDLTPPPLLALSDQQTTSVGSTATAVYRTDADATHDGVQVGDLFFPGTAGYFTDPGVRVALYTISPNDPEGVPRLVARDAAGNERTLPLDVRIRERKFRRRSLDVSDGFLERKVPPLLEAAGLDRPDDLLAGYLTVNRELRERTEVRLREICRESTPKKLWDGAFLSLPNAASLSQFGDHRTYRYEDEVVDHQLHLGYDLASVRGAAVPAAATGRVVHAGPLGIYGETVVLDHGLGLFTLYGHLRAINVAAGTTVDRGEEIGRTGQTGLAAGDHLHFSTMVYGIHVTPLEWWDGRWIRDHVIARLAGHATAADS